MTTEHVAHKRQTRIDGILELATELVVTHGLESLTLQRLAGELGVATSALYRYFPGKTELVAALQVRAIESLARDILAAIEGVEGTGKAAALARVWAALEVFQEGPERDAARHGLIDAFLSAPGVQLDEVALLEVEATLGPLLAEVAACFAEAARVGALTDGDPAVRTRVAWASVHGAHHLRRRDRIEPRALRAPALGRAMIETLFLGWGAEPRTIDAAYDRLAQRR